MFHLHFNDFVRKNTLLTCNKMFLLFYQPTTTVIGTCGLNFQKRRGDAALHLPDLAPRLRRPGGVADDPADRAAVQERRELLRAAGRRAAPARRLSRLEPIRHGAR